MLKDLLPKVVLDALSKYKENEVFEVRLRRNSPVLVNVLGRNRVLTVGMGVGGEKVYSSGSIIDYVVKKATENSLYAYNNQIKQGFITARGGIRLGIAGESVNSDEFMPTTIKNINSIDIRIPHQVKGCALSVFKFIYNKESGLKNTLIISPPGVGKTTMLRDICRMISEICEPILNTLLVDERFEIASVLDGEPMLDVGYYTDIVSGANKKYAFTNGIRALKPDVIITDELMSEDDGKACELAIKSGVKVIATIHATNHLELLEKPSFAQLIKQKFFDRYVVLSNKKGVGTCSGIFDKDLNCLYF